ncbi:MAG: hypothetical protein JXQ82_06470 [Methanomicrobiaceae archaeon]|nr:hypothetical protein [Methanomicrobiaceae archaeon]
MKESRETRSQGIIFKKQKIIGQVYKAQMDWNLIEKHNLEDLGHRQAEEEDHIWHRMQNARRKRKKIAKHIKASKKKNP